MINLSRSKILLVLALSILSLVYALPNMLSPAGRNWLQTTFKGYIPYEMVNLGLDLRGGVHLMLEVELDTVINDYLASLLDETRGALRKAKIEFSDLSLRGGGVFVRINNQTQVEAAQQALTFDRSVRQSTDGQEISLLLTEEARKERKALALDQSMEIVRRRVDETGTREPSIQRQGENRILVQLPGMDDPQRVKQLIGTTAKLTFRMVDDQGTAMMSAMPDANLPPGTEKLPTMDDRMPFVVVQKRVMVSGETLVDAQASFDQMNRPAVSFRFDSTGGRKFGNATKTNVGRFFAIVLDNKVISFPKINEPILGGSGIITGSFSTQETKDLSLLLRAGALPAPIKVLEERTVGPGLGADSVSAGTNAALLGTVLVVIFMLLSYGLFGIFSSVALIVNLAMIFAVLSLLHATLTLPGIAGIVLTIGAAVDANVLIYERIREELRLGRTPIAAIDTGYSRALSAIIDANITTLISAVLLMIFGTGPIKGFGVTLTVGTVTSLFTAIWVTRIMVVIWLRAKKPKALTI